MDIKLVPDNVRLLIDNRRLLDVVKLAVGLDLFSLIREKKPLADIALALDIDSQFTAYLLDTLSGFGFVEAIPSGVTVTYHSTLESRQYLARDSPLFIGNELLSACETGTLLEGFIRGGPMTPSIGKSHWTRERMQSIAGVSLLGGLQTTLAFVDLSGRTRLLDIGGGHGLYSILFARKYPGLQATIIELPEVAVIARDYVARCGAGEVVDVIAADYNDFEPEEAYDVVLLSNVAPPLEEIGRLLALAYECLEPGGMAVLRNFVSDAPADPRSSLTRLERYTRRGLKGLTTGELEEAMRSKGFTEVSRAGYHDSTVILTGVKQRCPDA